METIIREYREGDKAELIRCIEELQKHTVAVDPLKRYVFTLGFAADYVEKLLNSVEQENGKIYFAEVDAKVVGIIAGTIKADSPGSTLDTIPARLAWIREFFVDEAMRGQGVGSSLMKTLEDYLKSKDCDIVQVSVFVPNADAHRFYEAKGYSDRNVTMLKNLE